MATPSNTTDIVIEQKDVKKESDGKLPVASSEVEEATNPKTSAPTLISTNNETKDTTDLNEPGNSSNQKKTTASSTPSDPEKSSEIKHTNPSSNSGVSKEDDNVEVDNSNKPGEHQNPPEEGEEGDAKMDDSSLSHEQPKNSKETPASQTKPNKSGQPKADPNLQRFETADITSIRYKDEDEPDLLESILENATDPRLVDRLLGCIYGQALGDAYGLSTEFENRDDVIRKYSNCSLIPFPDYVLTGHNRRWMRGDWTDDTDQWILVLLTLMFHDGDERVFAQKLTNWIYYGYRELGDHGGMGLGANVSQVVRSHNYTNDPLAASERVWENGNRQAAPNGAVMRCSASAFVHFKDRKKVIETAELMCKTTHFDPRCIASCLAVCLAATDLIQRDVDAEKIERFISDIQQETIGIIGNGFTPDGIDLFRQYTDKRSLEELNLDEPGKIGYTYKCLASGFYGLRSTDSFEQTLHELIKYGGDADTNGAVCGTLYGARHGYRKLPYKWLRAMPNKKWLDQIIIKCLEKMNLIENQTMDTNE